MYVVLSFRIVCRCSTFQTVYTVALQCVTVCFSLLNAIRPASTRYTLHTFIYSIKEEQYDFIDSQVQDYFQFHKVHI